MSSEDHAASWTSCFPALAATSFGATVTPVEQGWDFSVVVLDGATVVRVPRRREVEQAAQVEARVLRELAPHLPVAVPAPSQICGVHGSTVYPWLAGSPIDAAAAERIGTETIAQQLAAFVDAVHAFPVSRAVALGVAPLDVLGTIARFEATVLPLVDAGPGPARLLDQAREALTDTSPALVHGDIGSAHLLVEEEGLAAVIDWSDVALAGRAWDAAWILNGLNGRLRRPFLEAWSGTRNDVYCADLVHRLGPWWEVLHGLDQNQPDFVSSGVRGIVARLPE